MIFIDRPPLMPTPAGNAEKMAQSLYNTLMPRTLEPFQVVSVILHSLIFDKNGIYNKVTTNRASTTPHRHEGYSTPHPKTDRDSPATIFQGTDGTNPKSPKEYAIDHTVGHTGHDKIVLYKVRWYRYSPRDEIYEPASHIPQHFIHRYWKGKLGHNQGRKK